MQGLSSPLHPHPMVSPPACFPGLSASSSPAPPLWGVPMVFAWLVTSKPKLLTSVLCLLRSCYRGRQHVHVVVMLAWLLSS